MSSPSLSLALWLSAASSGRSPTDDVVDALHAWAQVHLVTTRVVGPTPTEAGPDPDPGGAENGGTGPVRHGAVELLAVARPWADDGVALVLPVPGDTRGLPAGTSGADAAIRAGEAVVVGAPGARGRALVPFREGADVLHWQEHPLDEVPADVDVPTLAEAEYALRDAVREATDRIGRITTLGAGGDPRARIADAVAEHGAHRRPHGLSDRIGRVLDSADLVAAILDVATGPATPEAQSGSGADARDTALAPLYRAVRDARRAAVRAAADRTMERR